jgi:hypothetical protein
MQEQVSFAKGDMIIFTIKGLLPARYHNTEHTIIDFLYGLKERVEVTENISRTVRNKALSL